MNRRDEIRRRIFLKRQLIEVTEKEIEALENELQGPDPDPYLWGSRNDAQQAATL